MTANKIQTAKELLLIYIVAVIVGFGALCLTALIPQKAVMKHVQESTQYLHEQGLYSDLLGLKQGSMFNLDGYTDAIMLNEAAHIDHSNILKSVAYSYIFTRHDTNGYTKIDDLDFICKNGTNPDEAYSYGRYWHGYITFIRPLLGVLNYNNIRTINLILLSLFAALIVVLAQHTFGASMSLSFGLSLVFTVFPVVTLSMQFTSVFYIAFIGVIILLLFPRAMCMHPLSYFFILGISTSYLDLLTAPMVTLCYPLLFYLSLEKRNLTTIQITSRLIMMSAIWSLGYGGFWMAKWIIGYLLTGDDFIRNAFLQVGLHTRTEISPLNMVIMLARYLSSIPVIMTLCISLIFFLVTFEREKVRNNCWVLIIAIIPILWMTILNNHTYYHVWFSWRNIIPSVTCLLYFFVSTTSIINDIRKRLSQ